MCIVLLTCHKLLLLSCGSGSKKTVPSGLNSWMQNMATTYFQATNTSSLQILPHGEVCKVSVALHKRTCFENLGKARSTYGMITRINSYLRRTFRIAISLATWTIHWSILGFREMGGFWKNMESFPLVKKQELFSTYFAPWIIRPAYLETHKWWKIRYCHC